NAWAVGLGATREVSRWAAVATRSSPVRRATVDATEAARWYVWARRPAVLGKVRWKSLRMLRRLVRAPLPWGTTARAGRAGSGSGWSALPASERLRLLAA